MQQHPTATVVSVSDTAAELRVEARHCVRCQRGVGCGAGALLPARGATTLTLPLTPQSRLEVGQAVRLSSVDGRLVRVAAWVYGEPLSGLLIGTGLSTLLFGAANDQVALAGALLGFAGGCLLGYRRSRTVSAERLVVISGADRAAARL